MSANASCHKFIKASMESSEKGVHHILAIMNSDGTFAMSGSNKTMHVIINNPELYTALGNTISATKQKMELFSL